MTDDKTKRPRVVQFGAGATGRGHVGLLAWQAGAELVFVDCDTSLIDALNRAGGYWVELFGAKPQTVNVTGCRFIHAAAREQVAREIVDAALVLTSVFDQNLGDVAKTLALAVTMCRRDGRELPLNCIACENMQNSSSTLGRHVMALLDDEDRAWAEQYFGFPDCMISRVVPRPEPDPLRIIAEDYNEWTTNRASFKGQSLDWLPFLDLVDNQEARLERKLFMHNGGHATCGYFGYHYGHRFVHEAVADPRVASRVVAACDQIGEVVRLKHGFSTESIEEYKNDLYQRGAIPQMRDQILRVIRQPLRKLGGNERLIAPARLALAQGLPHDRIVDAIVAVLRYTHLNDDQAMAMQQMIASEGVGAVLEKYSGLAPGDPLRAEIVDAWHAWKL